MTCFIFCRRLNAHVRVLVLAGVAAYSLLASGCANRSMALTPSSSASSANTEAIELAPPAAGLLSAPSLQSLSREPLAAAPEMNTPAVAPPVDPLRPEVAVDLDSPAAHADLWARLRSGFGLPDLDTPLVRDREQWYATRPDYVARMTERGGRYLFHIVDELERRHMPTELALLPFIESAFNPQALSPAKASGMWQFIPSTGKHFSLKQNIFRDDRRDVLASTRAALDYLGKLHDMFGDWHLALAAYNWGEGSVQRAIARNQKLGLPTDYLSLNMPNETRYYLPKLQAVKNIIARPEAFAIVLPPLDNHPYFLSVPIERDIDVALATRLAGLSLEEFKALNPQMNKPVILASGTPQVLLPYDNAAQFVKKIAQHRGALATWTAWVAPKTLHPSDAARQIGMSEAALREVNHIPRGMLVKAGSALLVPRSEYRQADVPEQLADNATMSLAPDVPPLRRLSLKAGKRDTVASLARRYRVSAAQVGQWNKLPANGSFRQGQAVVVFVPTAVGKRNVVPATRVATAAVPRAATAGRQASSAKPRARTEVAVNRAVRGKQRSTVVAQHTSVQVAKR